MRVAAFLAVAAVAAAGVLAVAGRNPPAAPGPPSSASALHSAAPSPPPSHPEPAPSASAPLPAEPAETDVASLRARLDKATHIKDWVQGAKAFLALSKLDPTLIDDADERARVVAVAAGIAHEGRSELADAVFDTLGVRLGPSGLDLLYELAVSRGGTRGGQRARAILGDPAVVARETPALRVAFEFFVGSCAARRAMLARIVADGDRRTLTQLEVAHGARCANKKDPCCFQEDPAVADALAKLKARIES